MTEEMKELKARLIVGRKREGRCCYDPQAKRELIEAALQPGVSVAKLALTVGVNANLLRTWISKHGRPMMTESREEGSMLPLGPFIPVETTPIRRSVVTSEVRRLSLTLTNGTQADLHGLSQEDLLALLPVLAALPCSDSIRH